MQPMLTNLTAPQFADALRKINASSEAIDWAEGVDCDTAWNTCQNPSWLLFLLDAVAPLTAINNELLICAFAREVVHLTTDPRVLTCIETREAWAAGVATDIERDAARDAARAAVEAAAGDAAGAAAWDAARAAVGAAAGAAAWAAVEAAAGDAAGAAVEAAVEAAAWDAAWDAAWAAVGTAARAKQCAIIRELIPQPVFGYAPAFQS